MTTTWTDPRLARWEPVLATLPAIFREAINPEWAHRGLDCPVAYGEMVYATDGRVMVRTAPTPEIVAALAEAGRCDPPEKCPKLSEPLSIEFGPPVPLPDPGPGDSCEACGGAGHLPGRMCPGCGWSGLVTCPACEHEHDCDECEGAGGLPAAACPECHGEGVAYGGSGDDGFGVEIVPGVDLARHFVRMLRRHGVAEIQPAPSDPIGHALRFVGEGFEGCVMPLIDRKSRYGREARR